MSKVEALFLMSDAILEHHNSTKQLLYVEYAF